jgi:hypothetical protein
MLLTAKYDQNSPNVITVTENPRHLGYSEHDFQVHIGRKRENGQNGADPAALPR